MFEQVRRALALFNIAPEKTQRMMQSWQWVVPVQRQAEGAFGTPAGVFVQGQWQMQAGWCGQAELLLQKNLPWRGIEQVAATHHFGHTLEGTVNYTGEMVRPAANCPVPRSTEPGCRSPVGEGAKRPR